jgi:hypothetical protein
MSICCRKKDYEDIEEDKDFFEVEVDAFESIGLGCLVIGIYFILMVVIAQILIILI